MIRVVIVEDIANIREGIASLLNGTDGFSCAGEFETYEKMLPEIEKINPDVILSDIGLPGMSGIDGIKELKKYCRM
ncbi:MAG: response regulator [Melioribacteraceae bacterium]|nr:response regulator [Melioribacteraceae bacterium]